MPRRNSGAKLDFRKDRGLYYIVWTERGRSRKHSSGTADLERAQVFFAEWLQKRERRSGPSDPTEIRVTDLLADYARAKAPKVAAPEVLLNCIEQLLGLVARIQGGGLGPVAGPGGGPGGFGMLAINICSSEEPGV